MKDYYFGFSLGRIGTIQTTGTITASINSGTWCHVDLQSALGSNKYDDFAGAYKSARDGAGGGPWTVTWSATNLTYTISRGSSFTLTFPNTQAGNNAADILGFARNTSYTGQSSYMSIRRPLYVVRGLIDGQSNESDEREPEDIASEAVANDGSSVYGIARAQATVQMDWTQPAELNTPPGTIAGDGTAVFKRDATTLVPWSWQHAIEHARNIEPIALRAPGTTAANVIKLRADGASWRPERAMDAYQARWNIPIRAYLLGRIA